MALPCDEKAVAPGTSKMYYKEMIPPHVGTGSHRWVVQLRTLLCWTVQAIVGIFIFYQSSFPIDSKLRSAALGLLFPGAGYIASGNILSIFLLIITLALYPIVLFLVCLRLPP
jgi:hypothetical protein